MITFSNTKYILRFCNEAGLCSLGKHATYQIVFGGSLLSIKAKMKIEGVRCHYYVHTGRGPCHLLKWLIFLKMNFDILCL